MVVSTKTRRLRQLLRMALGREELGRRIKQAREEADLTQQELADRIGVQTAQSVSRYERGETEVRMRRIERIAEATGKPLEFFVGEKPATEPAAGVWAEVVQQLQRMEEREERNGELLRELLRRLPNGSTALGESQGEQS